MSKGAVFLDRDGVIIEDVHFLTQPDQVTLIPGSARAIQTLNRVGIPVVIITNQSGVARGIISEDVLKIVHKRLFDLLTLEGAHIDGLYYCPHHPTIGSPPYRISCDCRKPKPGLFLHAAAELDIDLGRSIVIGDSLRDLEAGHRAGCKAAILVRTGHGETELSSVSDCKRPPDLVAPDLGSAVRVVLEKGLVE